MALKKIMNLIRGEGRQADLDDWLRPSRPKLRTRRFTVALADFDLRIMPAFPGNLNGWIDVCTSTFFQELLHFGKRVKSSGRTADKMGTGPLPPLACVGYYVVCNRKSVQSHAPTHQKMPESCEHAEYS